MVSQEMIRTLQSVINLLDNPAYLKNEQGVLLVNDLFQSHGFCADNCEDQIAHQNFKINSKKINNNLTLCEIIPDEIQILKESTKKLAQAMTLL